MTLGPWGSCGSKFIQARGCRADVGFGGRRDENLKGLFEIGFRMRTFCFDFLLSFGEAKIVVRHIGTLRMVVFMSL